ncbi:protease inhibitor I42 family protein [Streptomyces gilvifuscus]|uniref:Protease inhibitor I42 family protein n=1 Tax=Streptomyces gilvifuscus TaxID=1550617 RepID=A0ABT5G3B3_9ACTN|nr:protease inhibitor I42 family protein [Streptomyces gilvifuscus]MDC2959285.1 protease inhibitor I42 family protein [Streptomyces gilvifuscus]
MTEVHADHTDDGKTLELAVGDLLSVALPVNMTTGFRWELMDSDPDCLSLLGQEVTGAPAGQAIGAGGSTAVFRFIATAPGPSQLDIKLWQGHEKDEGVAKFQLRLAVREE